MRILHLVPGLSNPANGIAVAAKIIAAAQGADLLDCSQSGACELSQYDEVWVHSMWLPQIWKACRRVLKAKVGLVRMTHANLDPLRLRCKGWKKLPVWHLVERRLMNRASRVIATCAAEADWNRQAGVAVPIEVLDLKRNFTLLPGSRSRTGGEKSSRHILYLGRRHPLKGVEFLEQAVEELNHDKGCGSPVQLRIVSDHSGEALEADWAWADVLCLPTLSENFGLVIAEALERGIPVVTTDGAPAWQNYFEQHPDAGVYLKGYRDGTAATRVNLLATALNYEIRSNLNP